jgi:hypothetical protein
MRSDKVDLANFRTQTNPSELLREPTRWIVKQLLAE